MQGDADSNSPASWPRRGRAAREGPIAIGGILDPTLFSPTPHLFLPPFLSFSLSSLSLSKSITHTTLHSLPCFPCLHYFQIVPPFPLHLTSCHDMSCLRGNSIRFTLFSSHLSIPCDA